VRYTVAGRSCEGELLSFSVRWRNRLLNWARVRTGTAATALGADSGSKVDPGFLAIRSRDLLDQDGVKLRLSLQVGAQQAKANSEADQADDDKRAAAFLEQVRR
jgi:hypothetical protein